jgi:hypothetical protein
MTPMASQALTLEYWAVKSWEINSPKQNGIMTDHTIIVVVITTRPYRAALGR